LIFKDGFSTKTEVTTISGRGVGLSAIYHELKKIQGTVEIQTVAGKGSKFIFTFSTDSYTMQD